ncbi:TetR/AcrR family transcriptional regulator [Gryllotalpicola reticulitermitis]|uniref:TetR/AcrR family transcriptional regulator n=1 Tax=Gryllotalpicola reticulitermitis TaxID=1184153 RepID=A0ABV8Q8R2_9MICO
MSRWSPDARERLEAAALDLFEEQGFAATTVPQIAERAGLTTRTFFRHFADKREVIYADDQLPAIARRILAEAPSDADPLELIVEGIRRFADDELEQQRAKVLRRTAIIMSDAGLLERSLRKRADLAAAIRIGYLERGIPTTTATLLAETVASVVETSLAAWVGGDDGRPLSDITAEQLRMLRAALTTDATRLDAQGKS